MAVPPDVQRVVKRNKRTGAEKAYFYFQRNRNGKTPGKRIPLGSDPEDPQFWERLRVARNVPDTAAPAVDDKSIAAMIGAFMASPEWASYAEGTRRDYKFYLDKLVAIWGKLKPDTLRPAIILAYRDTMRDSPGSANHMLSIGKTAWKWGIPRDYATKNPFRDTPRFDDDDDGHWPWPDWAVAYVLENAWEDLQRVIFLGVAVGQRESDLVRMGADAMERRGIWVRPIKTRKKRKAFWAPLSIEDFRAIDGWRTETLTFAAERRKEGQIVVPPGKTFILSPAGNAYTPEGLRSRWNRWLKTPVGVAFRKRWEAWMRAQMDRDGLDVAPDDPLKPTLHGLRSTAVVRRRRAGYEHAQISNDIGMSLQMVTRYSRFMDQMAAAENNVVLLDEAAARRRAKR